ncbi:MAG: toll/interleukin-1 receptor domain-containing protein [Candidatus Latescibacteria bacterium]|jgi:hypothetical protein|nr:toll/interleukin-1 receptor domain-containing protein [Candidatus Latescibacterota bacterium]
MKDVFVCHASEDKEEIVRPLADAFEKANISYWFDEAVIKWGDSITQKVNEGLKISRYVIVVLSKSFIQKPWPEKELNAALNIEILSGEVKVLPLLVGSESVIKEIITQYPLLNDKRYLPWDGDINEIVKALLSRLGRKNSIVKLKSEKTTNLNNDIKIHIPKIKKKFTQRDKDMFLRESYNFIKQYFQYALAEFEKSYDEVQTEFEEINKLKFISTIYIQGEISNQCKIWVGGFGANNSILYMDGRIGIDDDNSYNDFLSIAESNQGLGFEISKLWIGSGKYSDTDFINQEQAAEYLWLRFTDRINSYK